MITLTLDKKQIQTLEVKLQAIAPKNRQSVTRKAWVDVTSATEVKLKEKVTNDILHVRSSRLLGSIGYVVKDDGDNIVGTIGSGVRQGNRVPYANIHETGGVIKPKKGKFLWIPIRQGSTEAIRMGLWNYKAGPKAGTPKKRISFSSNVVKWIPVRQVTIPARHYMSITRDEMQDKIMEIMSRRIEQEVAK